MGDAADMALEYEMNLYENQWFDEDGFEPPLEVEKTCVHCGEENLNWVNINGQWFLHKEGELHECSGDEHISSNDPLDDEMKNEIKQKAIKKAGQSISKFKISAIAFTKNGNIIASATNRPRFDREGGGQHAEMAVLEKAGSKNVASIVLCRIGNGGDILPIEPCKRCQKVLDKEGIKVLTVRE
jgi:cytidine deaminase